MATRMHGREPELRRLRRLVRRSPTGVVVRGPAGIGKTRLVRALARAHRDTSGVGWALGSPGRSAVPLGAFADLLADGDAGEAERDAAGVAAAVRRSLAGAGGRPLVVADDVHAFDPTSARVLLALVADPEVMVAATLRDAAPVREEVAVTAVQLEPFDLGPLADAEARQLVEEVAGGPLADFAAGQLQQLARGNPLFATELVLDAVARGTLREARDGVLRLTEPLEPPAGVTDLLSARFAQLGDDEQRALQLLAIAEPLPLSVGRELTPASAFEHLAAADLVELDHEAAATRLWLAHPLLGEVVASSTSPQARHEHQRRLIEAMRDRPDRDPVRIARWQLESGDAPDGELLLAGARAAVARFDAGLAEELARAAATVGADGEATLVLGEALAAQPGRAEEAEEVLDHLARAADDEGLRARATVRRALNQLFGLGRPDLAAATAEEARPRVLDAGWRAELGAAQGLSAMLLGDVSTAARVGVGIEMDRGVDPRSVVTVRVVSTLARVMLGELAGTEKDLDEADELIERITLADHLALAPLQLGLTRTYLDAYAGRLDEAHARCLARIEEATAAAQTGTAGLWTAMRSHVELLAGDLDVSLAHGIDAEALLLDQDVLRVRPQTICQWGAAAAFVGRREDLRRALELVAAAEPDPAPRLAVHVGRLAAWVALLDGDEEAGVERLVAAGEQGLVGEHPVWAALTLYDAVRVGRADAVASQLAAIAADVDAELVLAMSAHATAAAEHDVVGLEAAAGRLWEGGAALHAAEALADAADRHAAAGDARREVAMRFAARTRLPAGAVDVWTLRGRLAAPQLTPREQEIVDLVARGLSSREIAEELVVSRRTVDNHLSVVYRKLGVAGRHDLLGPPHAPPG